MSYSDNNKIRVYAEDATNTSSELNGITYTDDDWNGLAERKRGAKEGIAKSQEFNTALKQSTLLATTLAEIIAKRYETLVTTDLSSTSYTNFENYIEALAGKFAKDSFLLDGEVKKKHLNKDILEGTFSSLTAGYAQYASEDKSKGTIEERLTKLGFKEETITWNSRIVSSYALEGSVRRSGNYCLLRFVTYDFYFETTQEEKMDGNIVLGTVSKEFFPTNRIQFDVGYESGSYNAGGGYTEDLERDKKFKVYLHTDGRLVLDLDSNTDGYINNITMKGFGIDIFNISYSNDGGIGYIANPL